MVNAITTVVVSRRILRAPAAAGGVDDLAVVADQIGYGAAEGDREIDCQIASNRDPFSRPIMTPSVRENLG
jgi:hypothetical protein